MRRKKHDGNQDHADPHRQMSLVGIDIEVVKSPVFFGSISQVIRVVDKGGPAFGDGTGKASYVFEELKKKGIYVRYFSKPERISDYLRISIGTDEEMQEFIKELSNIVKGV